MSPSIQKLVDALETIPGLCIRVVSAKPSNQYNRKFPHPVWIWFDIEQFHNLFPISRAINRNYGGPVLLTSREKYFRPWKLCVETSDVPPWLCCCLESPAVVCPEMYKHATIIAKNILHYTSGNSPPWTEGRLTHSAMLAGFCNAMRRQSKDPTLFLDRKSPWLAVYDEHPA